MPKSKSVNISLEEYNRLQEAQKSVDGCYSALAKVNENYNLLLDEFKIATEKYRSTDEPSVKREAWWTLLVAIKNS